MIADEALTAAAMTYDGAMIALVPTPEDAARLAVPGYEPAQALHLTLTYLGKGDTWSPTKRIALEAALRRLAAAPVDGYIWWATALGRSPETECAAYLVRGPGLVELHHRTKAIAMEIFGPEFPPDTFPSFLPHITAGYHLPVESLRTMVPVRFDRLRLSFAGTYERDIALGASEDADARRIIAEEAGRPVLEKLVEPRQRFYAEEEFREAGERYLRQHNLAR